MSRSKFMLALSLLVVASQVLAACAAPTATPQTVEVTRVVAGTPETMEVVVTATPQAAEQTDTIIVATWQQPRGFLDYANSQAIRVEIDLVYKPRFVIRTDFGFQPNPDLVEGELPSFENGGAVLEDVTVKAGEPIFSTETYVVEAAAADTPAKQLVVTGKIKSGLVWDDGAPLTANDIVLAWQKNCSADSGAIDVTYCPLGSVDGAGGLFANFEAPDDTTLVASYVPGALDPVYVIYLYTGGGYGILPSHLFKDMSAADILVDERAIGGETAVPLGYGPYKMVEWKKGDRIVFEPNPLWQGEPPVTPNLIYRFYADSTSLAAAVIAGEIDSSSAITGINVDQAPYMESVQKQGVIAYSVDGNAASFEMLYINFNDPNDPALQAPHPVLSDYNVRKAISMALDRQQMVDAIYYGQSAVVQQPHLPQMISYDESLGIIDYDPEGAKQLMEEAGWVDSDGDGIREKDGVKASINYLTTSGSPPRTRASQILQANLKDIGIEVNLTYQPSSVTFSSDGLYGRKFDLIQFANVFSVVDPGGWWFGVAACNQIPTPENGFSGSNFAGWCDEEASAAVTDAAYLTLDTEQRLADWKVALARYFENGYPLIPLYTRPNYLATAPGLENAELDPTEYFTWNDQVWRLFLVQ